MYTPHEDNTLYAMWEELVRTVDPEQRDNVLQKIGNDKFENFAIIPLFNVYMEVVINPNSIADWAFPGWDGGDVGHTWRIAACKQEKPCQ